MKRLTSMDFARGLAIFFMTIFHAFLNDWSFMKTGDLGALSWWEYPFAFIFFIFGHWRGFFIMISAVVHFYTMGRSYKSGKEPHKILLKQIVSGVILFGMGALFNAIFSPWGAMLGLQTNGSWSWDTARIFVYFTEALQNIAIGIIIASIIFFFMTKKEGMQKVIRNVIILASLAFVIILVTPYVQTGISNFLGYDVNAFDASASTTRHPFVVYILYQIGGREAPIFPMLASSLFGVCIGTFLIQDKPNRKQLLRVGYWTSLGLFLFGIAYLFLVDVLILKKAIFSALIFSHIHPAWFAFANSGLEIAALLFLLQRVEFNANLNKDRWLRNSRWFRRWGVLALTIYMFQAMLFPIERIVTLMFGNSINFNLVGEATFLESLLIATILYLVWEGLIRLWELVKFIGSFEWFLVYFNGLTSGRKINHKDPLRIKEILYEVEPVSFVDTGEPEELQSLEKIDSPS